MNFQTLSASLPSTVTSNKFPLVPPTISLQKQISTLAMQRLNGLTYLSVPHLQKKTLKLKHQSIYIHGLFPSKSWIDGSPSGWVSLPYANKVQRPT